MAARHLTIAQEKGPKAGFDFYMAQSAPTARARQDEIRGSGNKKRQFEAYCGIFGENFAPVSANGAVVQQARKDDEAQGLLERLASSLGFRVVADDTDEDEDDEVGVQVVATPPQTRKRTTRKPAAAKQQTTTNDALAKGDSFEYHSKGGSVSEWEVTKVAANHYVANNGRRDSKWKKATVDSLIQKGVITL